MRILHIINSLGTGGAEKLLLDTLPLYQLRGHKVDLLLFTYNETPFLEELRRSAFSGKIYIPEWPNVYSPKNIGHIFNVLKREHYDIIHVHLFPPLYYTAIVKWLLPGHLKDTRLVFTEHNTENRRLNSPIYRQVDKIIYQAFDKVTAITPQVKNALISKLGIKPSKIEVIYNGINLNKYQSTISSDIRGELGLQDKKILIQVSRFTEQKDQKTVIRALRKLPNDYALLLVGDGSLRPECEIFAKEIGVADRTYFLGVRMDVPTLLKSADISIQSSHWEGFGLVAVEGMAAGKPVIASDVPGLAEIVKGNGLLFKPGDPDDLASRIVSLESPNLYDTLSQKSLSRCQDFGIDTMVTNMLNLYISLLNKE